jgi:hypothetical protein
MDRVRHAAGRLTPLYEFMESVNHKLSSYRRNERSQAARPSFDLEALEDRQLMATLPWGHWPTFLRMDQVFQQYPWLTGSGFNVAVIDKGIDYYHPALGGNQAQGVKSPKIVNVADYRDNDNDPFPSESEATDQTTAHGTGVAGILAANPWDLSGKHYQGMLQQTKLYNLRTDRFRSQDTIKQALQWVLANHEAQNITAVNLTDFVGTARSATSPVYAAEVKALWEAGVFILTPVANDWLGNPNSTPPTPPKEAIGFPAKDPFVYGSGGLQPIRGTGGVITGVNIHPKTQRGAGLDILGPADNVSLIYYTPSTGAHTFVHEAGTGNSWGTPHILGTAVMIQQIDPSIMPADIMQILQDSGPKLVDPDGTGTYARLDILAAVQLAYQRRDDAFDQGGGNDTRANASQINLNSLGTGTVNNLKLLVGDSDYYKFNVTASRETNIKSNYGGGTPYTAQLVDADGNLVGNISPGSGLTQTLVAGQYTIVLTAPQSMVGAYSIQITGDDPDEPPPPPVVPGKTGTFNGIAYDASNNLHFVWFDYDTVQLSYSRRNAGGSTWSPIQVIDNSPDVGAFVSLAVNAQGRPAVAYYDPRNADLKFAQFNGTNWDVAVADSRFTTGYYPSLKFNGNTPAITYYSKTGGNLKFATRNGTGWTSVVVDGNGDVGRSSSLALHPGTGNWSVAYDNGTDGMFRYAQRNSKGAWAITNVTDTEKGGGFTSLSFDAGNQPGFSFYDARNADLKFARRGANNVWSTVVVAAKNSQGLYTSMFFEGMQPVIYYFNRTTDAAMSTRRVGNKWVFENAAAGGGRFLSLAVDKDGFETFAWQETASGDIKIANA